MADMVPLLSTRHRIVCGALSACMILIVSLPLVVNSRSSELESTEACEAELHGIVKALDFSSIAQYEKHLIASGHKLPCGLKGPKAIKTSTSLWSMIFGTLFEQHAGHQQTTKHTHAVQRNLAKGSLVTINEGNNVDAANGEIGASHIATNHSQSLLLSRKHVQRVLENPHSKIQTSILTPHSNQSNGNDATPLTSKVSKGSVDYSRLQAQAKQLGYNLVPLDLYKRAAALGFKILPAIDRMSSVAAQPSPGAALAGGNVKLPLPGADSKKLELGTISSQLASSSHRHGGEKSSMNVGSPVASTSDETIDLAKSSPFTAVSTHLSMTDSIAHTDDSRLQQEAQIEEAMHARLKGEARMAKEQLRMEAIRKTQQAQSAAVEVIKRYAGVISFPSEKSAKMDQLYLHSQHPSTAIEGGNGDTIEAKIREAEEIRAEAGKAADKQLKAYKFLDFSDDGVNVAKAHSGFKAQALTERTHTGLKQAALQHQTSGQARRAAPTPAARPSPVAGPTRDGSSHT